jgi:hypothetical protein
MLAEEWFDHGGGIHQYVQGPTSPCVSFPYLFVLLRQQLAPENHCFLEQQYAAFKVVHTPLFKFEVAHTVALFGSACQCRLPCGFDVEYCSFQAGRLQREQLIKVCQDVAGDSQLVNAIQQLYKCQKVLFPSGMRHG